MDGNSRFQFHNVTLEQTLGPFHFTPFLLLILFLWIAYTLPEELLPLL